MSRLGLLLLVGLPSTGWAQEGGAAGELGRLFFTPAERAALVAARRAGPGNAEPAAASAGEAPAPPAVPRLRLDGLVHRDAQPSIAFLNRRPVEDGGRILEYRVIAGPSAVTLLGEDGRRIVLRVGQSLLREEGRIVDPLPPQSLSSPP